MERRYLIVIVRQPEDSHIKRSVGVPSLRPLSVPQPDEAYFDRLAAFGVACLVAAVVGKLLVTNLSPKQRP